MRAGTLGYAVTCIVSRNISRIATVPVRAFCRGTQSHILGLSSWHTHNRYAMLVGIARGMCLCDVPTPALLLDHSTAATWRGISPRELDAALNDANAELLSDLLFVHTATVAGRDAEAGAVGTVPAYGFGRTTPAEPVVLATLDCTKRQAGGAEAFLGLGMNNHFTPGYYWGRSTGPGAAMPAPGVALRSDAEEALLRLVRLENSNDGKRSEWCEFLTPQDQMQLVVPVGALGAFDTVVGVTRDGQRGVPRGAEPIVEACWTRDASSGVWGRTAWSEDFEVSESSGRPNGQSGFMASWGVGPPSETKGG